MELSKQLFVVYKWMANLLVKLVASVKQSKENPIKMQCREKTLELNLFSLRKLIHCGHFTFHHRWQDYF